jgi:antitoxin component of MazEF toxin-antitoxin module
MERKLVKQGRDALTVTLPSKWIKDRGLKAGQEVDISVEKNNLIISSEIQTTFRETTIDVKDNERSMIWHKVISKYMDGFDKITVLHNNPEITQLFSQSLLGMIIEEHTSTKTVLKTLISTPENNIDIIIRRIFHMFEQQALILESVAKGIVTAKEVKAQEKLLDVNIYYSLRYINKYHMQLDSYKHFLLCATIESAADLISVIALHIGKDVKLAKTISDNVKLYNKYFFTKDLSKLYFALREFRNSVPKKTFVQGLTFEFAEILYNDLGYLMGDSELDR